MDKQIAEWTKMVEAMDGRSAGQAFSVEKLTDPAEIKETLPAVLDMVMSSYKDGYKGITNLERLVTTTPMLKVVRDPAGSLIACTIYRQVKGSMKITGAGTNKTKEGKLALQEIVKSDISPYTNWVWVEASGPFEHYFKKHNGYPIPNEYAALVLEKFADKVALDPDGFHYERVIGDKGDAPVRKVIFGFRNADLAEKVMSDANYEIKRKFFNLEALTERDREGEPKGISYASSLVNQLVDLYDEEGFRELTPGLSAELDDAVDILKQNKDWKPWVANMYALAVDIRDRLPEIKLHGPGIDE